MEWVFIESLLMESLIELFKSEPVAFVIIAVGLVIFLPLFTVACARTDFTAEGQHKARKNNKAYNANTLTFNLLEKDESTSIPTTEITGKIIFRRTEGDESNSIPKA